MDDERARSWAADRKDSQSSTVGPALDFYDPRADCDTRYRQLMPTDDFYGLAVAAYHLSQRLGGNERDALLYELAKHWPRRQGAAKVRTRDFLGVRLLARRRQGWTLDDLAHAYKRDREDVGRLLRHAEGQLDRERTFGASPGIETDGADPPPLAQLGPERVDPARRERRGLILEADRRLIEMYREKKPDAVALAERYELPWEHLLLSRGPEVLDDMREIPAAPGRSAQLCIPRDRRSPFSAMPKDAHADFRMSVSRGRLSRPSPPRAPSQSGV